MIADPWPSIYRAISEGLPKPQIVEAPCDVEPREEVIVTPEVIEKFVLKDGDEGMHALGKALVVIHQDYEFDQEDAKDGVIGARYYLKHGKLEPWQMTKWLHKTFFFSDAERNGPFLRICRYWTQLNENAVKRKKARHG